MPRLNRRDFLKALGISGGASALSACGLDTNRYYTPVENLLPYVVKPEQVVPGTYTFFATTVLKGPHAQPVAARHRDGRVTFVSANHRAPTKPAVATANLFELQKHYNPSRVQQPQDGGAEASWSDAVDKLASAIRAARSAGKKVAWLGGYRSGAAFDLIREVADTTVFWEPGGYDALANASEALFGKRVLPYYDLSEATYLLSFGAPFLSGWGDADIEDRYATARNPNVGHSVVRFGLVAPHRGATGANADDFHGVKPGSEVLVARAIAGLVASKKGASAAVKALASGVSVDDAASASGLSAADIEAIASRVATEASVVLPGGASGTTDLAAATYVINLAAGAKGFTLAGYQGQVSSLSALQALMDDLKAGRVGVLLLDEANPVYALPGLDAASAIGKADLVVSMSSQPDETAALAGLVLPVADTLEDWGSESPVAGLHLVRQPSMTPLYGAPALGDVLLGVGRSLGLEASEAATELGLDFSVPTWRDYVAGWFRAKAWSGEGDFQDFWEQTLMAGFVSVPPGNTAPLLTAASYSFGEASVPSGDLVLCVHTHPFRQDGRYAGSSWAQETPDPLTGIVWDSWVEVNSATANKLGLKFNDQVEIKTEAGTATAGVYVLPGVADGVVALALGNGHTKSGAYADGYGINAAALTQVADPKGATAYAPIAATLSKTGAKGGLVTTFRKDGMSDEQRNFGVVAQAAAVAKHGDAASDHPGDLTGIHHLELDHRITDDAKDEPKPRGEAAFYAPESFYQPPEHPTYRFGMTVDVNACTGCGACAVACSAENNLPVVGKAKVAEGRIMNWIRINRYWEEDIGGTDDVRFVPMMCQHCGHAGCENVCPVLATYHNLDGLNAMVYNRCVGTRYCANACPFSVRRFNYHTYTWPESLKLQLNPDVSTRTMGVMEKCTFCVQRLRQVKSAWKDREGVKATVPSEVWEQVPACAEACPSQAITFGNLRDVESKVSQQTKSGRAYQPLAELNVRSAVTYLAKANFHVEAPHHGGHGDDHHDSEHGDDAAGAN